MHPKEGQLGTEQEVKAKPQGGIAWQDSQKGVLENDGEGGNEFCEKSRGRTSDR